MDIDTKSPQGCTTKVATCPNCTSPVANHSENGCVLAAFISVLRDRATCDEARLKRLHANCDVDLLWTELGKVLDKLEDGAFSAADTANATS